MRSATPTALLGISVSEQEREPAGNGGRLAFLKEYPPLSLASRVPRWGDPLSPDPATLKNTKNREEVKAFSR